ncbi:MAG: alpha-2-macroglobulin family protein, partial [Saprospiraceae bacterium]
IKVNLNTDKEKYGPLDNVNLTVKVKDENGNPLQGDFSVAVVDDQIHTFADDKQDNILSRLLMTSELKGEIEEPNFYFNPEEEKADKAIDFVMMTHGWRRFQWRDILKKSEHNFAKQIKNEADKLVVMGRATIDGKALPNIRVWTTDHKRFAKTDKNGVFVFEDLDVPVRINFKHRGLKAEGYFHYKTPRGFEFINPIQKPRGRASGLKNIRKEKAFAEPANVDKLMDDVAEVEVEENGKFKDLNRDGKNLGAEQKQDLAVNEPMAPPPPPVIEEVAEFDMDGMEDMMDMEEEPVMLDEVVVKMPAERREMALGQAVAGLQVAGKIAAPGDAGYFFNTGTGFDIPNVYVSHLPGSNSSYHAKQFYAPQYNQYHRQNPENYTDERKTLYWNPAVKTNKDGEAKFTFSQGTLTSTYRIILEGITNKGNVIHNESTYISQEPFNMDCKTPIEVTHGDELILPIVFQNNTDRTISGNVQADATPGMTLAEAKTTKISVPANGNKTHYFKMNVSDTNMKGQQVYTFSFVNSTTGKRQVIRKNIKINNKGFPRAVSLSSKEMQRTFNFNIDEFLENSLEGELNIYPNIMDELVSGTESIFREPYGCFEQTSSSNYPNIMALQYMQEQGEMDPALQKRALGLLKKGYNRLVGFECSNGGFEWFGNDPAHETLTAYGLVQFHDLEKVFNGVDMKMVKRTQAFLVDKKDGKGGYKQRGGGLDSFRGSSYNVGNAYITYALSEVGYTDISKEAALTTKEALDSKDAYRLALAAIINYNLGNKSDANECLKAIEKQAKTDFGKITVGETVTRSYG